MKRALAACIAAGLLAARPVLADSLHVHEPTLPSPLTLQEAVDIALQYQSNVGIAAWEAEAARAGITIANSSFFPQVTPLYDYGAERANGTVDGSAFEHVTLPGVTDISGSLAQVNGSITIADNGTRSQTSASARNTWRASVYGLENTRQSTILTVSTDYYALLEDKELAKVADANVATTKTTLDATTAEAQAGTIAQINVLQAQANYENAVVQQITAHNNVHIAESTIKNAMGVYGGPEIVTPDTPTAPPSPTPDTKIADDYMKVAVANRPDVQQAFNLIDADRHNVHIAELASSLQIDGTANETYQSQPGWANAGTIELDLSYPLFDAGAARAKVRQAEAALEETRLTAEATLENASTVVTQAYLQREAARASTVAAQSALIAAQQNFTAAQDSEKEGVDTIVDVITAQAALVTAETNSVQAIYNYYTADAQLQDATGTNDNLNNPARLTHDVPIIAATTKAMPNGASR